MPDYFNNFLFLKAINRRSTSVVNNGLHLPLKKAQANKQKRLASKTWFVFAERHLNERGVYRGNKVKMVIELDDLSSSVIYRARFSKRRKKEKKMEIKAIITTWSTRSKTPSRSQFVTDKKHCVADRLMLFCCFIYLFYPFFFYIFDARLPFVSGA